MRTTARPIYDLKWILLGKTQILPFSSSELSENGQNAEAKWKVNKAKTNKRGISILLFSLLFPCPFFFQSQQRYRETKLEFIYTY